MRRCVSLLVPALVLAAIVAAACGGGSKKTIDVPGGGQISSSDKIPDAFPNDFPIYKGAKVTGSVTGKQQGISGTSVIWETSDSLDKVKSFFDSEFAKDNWKSESNGEAGGTAFWSGKNKDGSKVFYFGATNADGKTTITAVVGDNQNTSSSGDETSTSGSSSLSNSNKTATAEAEDSGSSSSGGSEKSPTASPLPPEVKLASDFPKDRVPFPSGARVTSSSSFGSGGTKTFIVELYVKDSPENAAKFFNDELPKLGWSDSFQSNSNGEYYVAFTSADTTNTGEAANIGASASDTPGYTVVSVSVVLGGT